MPEVPLFLFGTSVTSSPASGVASVWRKSPMQCRYIPVLASLPLLTPGNSAFRQNRNAKKCKNLCCFADQQLK